LVVHRDLIESNAGLTQENRGIADLSLGSLPRVSKIIERFLRDRLVLDRKPYDSIGWHFYSILLADFRLIVGPTTRGAECTFRNSHKLAGKVSIDCIRQRSHCLIEIEPGYRSVQSGTAPHSRPIQSFQHGAPLNRPGRMLKLRTALALDAKA
jgi:hypothetical protein